MNDRQLERLFLSRATIVRDMDVCVGLARAYQESSNNSQDRDTVIALSASHFRRAASHALLLGNYQQAQDYFRQAAIAYNSLNSPYSIAMATLSAEGHEFNHWIYDWFDFEGQPSYSYHQLAYILLMQSSITNLDVSYRRIRDMRISLEPYRSQPFGTLGFSTSIAIDLIDGLNPNLDTGRFELTEVILPIFVTYSSAIRQAISNRYHWKRLLLPFHPAEPDIFSIALMTDNTLRTRFDTSILRVVDNISESSVSSESRILFTEIMGGISR